jgi:hypothetical protein
MLLKLISHRVSPAARVLYVYGIVYRVRQEACTHRDSWKLVSIETAKAAQYEALRSKTTLIMQEWRKPRWFRPHTRQHGANLFYLALFLYRAKVQHGPKFNVNVIPS